MRRILLMTVALSLSMATLADARSTDDIKTEISSLEARLNTIKAQLRVAKGQQAEDLTHQFYFLANDHLDLYHELADSMEDQDKADNMREKIQASREELDRSYYKALEMAQNSYPPEVDNLSVIETKREYGYVTMSAKVDVENPGERRKLSITVKGLNAMGYQIEDILFFGTVESGESITLTETAMLTEQEANDIRNWEIAEVKYYAQ